MKRPRNDCSLAMDQRGAGRYMVRRRAWSRFFEVIDTATGELVCITVYRRGAEEVARRLSSRRNQATDGLSDLTLHTATTYLSRTVFRGRNPRVDQVQDMIDGLKAGDGHSTRLAAESLASHPAVQGFRGVVVPAPRSECHRRSLLPLAKDLVRRGVGDRAVEAVRRQCGVPSSRELRRAGGRGVPCEQHLPTLEVDVTAVLPDDPVLLVDDVASTGANLRAAAAALRQAGHRGRITTAAVAVSSRRMEDFEHGAITRTLRTSDLCGIREQAAGLVGKLRGALPRHPAARVAVVGAGIAGIALTSHYLLVGRHKSRSSPDFQWRYPSSPADKWQWVLDIMAGGFGGQGTVYINSPQEWHAASQSLRVHGTPDTKTGRKVQFPIGWTCSRMTNILLGYHVNAGANFDPSGAYDGNYEMTSSVNGTKQAEGTYRGYAEYATRVLNNATVYGQAFDRWSDLGQVNVFIRDSMGSGHVGLVLKVDRTFRLRDPWTRKPYPDCLLRVAADGGRPDKVYSAGQTSLRIIYSDDVEGKKAGKPYEFDLWSMKAGDNDGACRVEGPYRANRTVPLLFQYMHF